MTTRRPKPPAQPAADSAVQVIEIGQDAPPTAEQLLAQFFGEAHADDDVTCAIWELSGAQHKERGYLFSFPFDSAPPIFELYEQLLTKFGPGWYELHAQKPNGQFVTRKQFQVGSARDRKRAVIPDREKPDDAPRTLAAAAPAGSDVSPALAAILENQQRSLDRLFEMQMQRPPERDTIAEFERFAQLQKLLAPSSPTPIGEMMSFARDFLKLKDELTGDDDGGSPLASALRQFAPAINRAVDQLSHSQNPARPSAAAPAVTEQPQAPNGNTEGFTMNFDSVFAELAAHAERGTPAPDVAIAVLEYLAERPVWIEQAVLGMIADEQERVVGRIVGAYPKLADKREWLVDVVKAINEQIESAEDDPPAAEPGGPGAEAPAP